MLANQLHRHITAALVRDVNHFLAGGFLQHHGDDLVFLFQPPPPILKVWADWALMASK